MRGWAWPIHMAAMTTPSATPDPVTRRLEGRWSRIGLALLAGLATALAHPPFGVLPGLIGYPLLMILAERSSTRRGAFWMGWLAGFAYFLVSCWWVAEAFFVNPEQIWMAPFAASLLPAGLGLFWAVATALHRHISPVGWRRALVFAALFCLLEWLRGHVLTGFPWNPAGASWKAGSAMSQAASVIGVYGLSLLTVTSVCLFASLLERGGRRARFLPAGIAAAVLASTLAWGAARLSSARVEPSGTVVRIVQAAVDQESKWTPEAYRGIVDRYLSLTRQPAARRPDLVIWPEGALPASANQVFGAGSPDADAIAEAVQPGQSLILGLGRGALEAEGERYYNSLFVLTDRGGPGLTVSALYDKYRLVPFGEYLPGGGWLTPLGVRSLTHMPTDFSAGPLPAPIAIPGAPPAQPLICYESLYPGFTPGGGARPDWIVNISNDAWFGRTSGPLQHLNLASYRAIETGLPIARATPTGVSAMIDPWGRVVDGQRLESGAMGVIDADLPRPAAATPYGRVGDIPALLAILIGVLLGGRYRRRTAVSRA